MTVNQSQKRSIKKMLRRNDLDPIQVAFDDRALAFYASIGNRLNLRSSYRR